MPCTWKNVGRTWSFSKTGFKKYDVYLKNIEFFAKIRLRDLGFTKTRDLG